METKRVSSARFVDFDVNLTNMLPWQQMSDFPKHSRFVEKSISAIICLNFTFCTNFLVKIGHRAIKVHVNKGPIPQDDEN